jgi:hypothetical protein
VGLNVSRPSYSAYHILPTRECTAGYWDSYCFQNFPSHVIFLPSNKTCNIRTKLCKLVETNEILRKYGGLQSSDLVTYKIDITRSSLSLSLFLCLSVVCNSFQYVSSRVLKNYYWTSALQLHVSVSYQTKRYRSKNLIKKWIQKLR